eukprot:5213605-Amphidinium_carterae.1
MEGKPLPDVKPVLYGVDARSAAWSPILNASLLECYVCPSWSKVMVRTYQLNQTWHYGLKQTVGPTVPDTQAPRTFAKSKSLLFESCVLLCLV